MTTKEFQVYVSDTIIPNIKYCISVMEGADDEFTLDCFYGRVNGIIETVERFTWGLFKDDISTALTDPYLSSAKTLLKYYDLKAVTVYRDKIKDF